MLFRLISPTDPSPRTPAVDVSRLHPRVANTLCPSGFRPGPTPAPSADMRRDAVACGITNVECVLAYDLALVDDTHGQPLCGSGAWSPICPNLTAVRRCGAHRADHHIGPPWKRYRLVRHAPRGVFVFD